MQTKLRQLGGSAIAVAAAGLWLAGAGEAAAQGPGQKPFQDVYRRPNVSAYNQISNFGDNPQAAGNIYQQLVQPQQEQQRMRLEQMDQTRQVGKLQNQVNQIQRDTRARQIDTTIRPTGHASTYMNYSHYYRQR
jgi:hypothetical protein